ncbi:serine hydrolase-domain-containing protein [Aspergillus leporis]|uniref:Serine hydrolase-domain-containing protein n=1 Tax=Aspergillus leporis TaxID=41062 RepID=A0A5N5X268_9EURO|nr:serine hydrolase-domain-containing protein [Aspergillus leporis]
MTISAAIRYELGNEHTYDFVEGVVPWEPSVAINMNEPTFSFCDPEEPQSCRQAARDLEEYIKEEGPFDGIIGFSMGAAMALSWLVNWFRSTEGSGSDAVPFKVAIFFSNAIQPYDHDELNRGHIAHLDSAQVGKVIDIPTAHIWGSADPQEDQARWAVDFCNPEKKSIFVHAKGHEIPNSVGDTISIAKVVNRAICLVQGK